MKLSKLKGIGEKTEKLFEKLGIFDTDELCMFLPKSYDIYKEPVFVDEIDEEGIYSLYLSIFSDVEQKTIRNLVINSVYAVDEKGKKIKLTWFNMPFIKGSLKRGSRYIVRGRVSFKGSFINMEQPKLYTPAEYKTKLNNMQPIYPLVKGLSNNLVIKAVKQCLELRNNTNIEYLTPDILDRFELINLNDAVKSIHFPSTFNEMTNAKKRFAFDEFLAFMMKMNLIKASKDTRKNECVIIEHEKTRQLIENLSFKLTEPQRTAYNEMLKDMSGPTVMNRLIQGDVGSGKTIVAVLAMVNAAFSGYQAAMMAPTEVLAKQHYEYICKLFEQNQITLKPVLLVGSTLISRKKKIYEQIKNKEADIIIGTHAIIQEKVEYNNLGLVITDEQHRFGVNQREKLSKKGNYVHVCVMSATPIPRTLGIILYGDLDVSIINALPEGRLPIKNAVVDENYRKKAYSFIENEVKKSHQAYVICPMVENNELSESENVIDYTAELRKEMPDLRIDFIHGQMGADKKNDIMERFKNREFDVLVSTTVIEVGINVPNATVMLIENAEKFGLAQLHQLRGRVGRGKDQSYCIFINTSKKEAVKKRLEIIGKSNDGFYIAEEDLKLRGPGDFFGVRQSGDMNFSTADIYSDADMLKKANDCSKYILQNNIQIDFSNYRKDAIL